MRHTFSSCLIRCANMNGIRWVLLKIQSGHDSVHRRTDGQGETSIRGDKNCMLRVKILSLHVFFLKNEKDWLMLVSKAPWDIYIIHEVDTTLPILPYHRANIHCGLHFKTNRILEYSFYHTNTELWYGKVRYDQKIIWNWNIVIPVHHFTWKLIAVSEIHRCDIQVIFELYSNLRCLQVLYSK